MSLLPRLVFLLKNSGVSKLFDFAFKNLEIAELSHLNPYSEIINAAFIESHYCKMSGAVGVGGAAPGVIFIRMRY